MTMVSQSRKSNTYKNADLSDSGKNSDGSDAKESSDDTPRIKP